MALCKGDCIEMDNESGGRSVYVVRSCSKRDIIVRLHNDARTDKQIMKAGERQKYRIQSIDEMRKRHARKVTIMPLGDVILEDKRHRGND